MHFSVRGFERSLQLAALVITLATTGVARAGNKAQITFPPSSQSAGVGATVNFFVGAGGDPTILYQWSFNGSPISGATSSILTLQNIQSTNQGSYRVVVTNDFGSSTSAVVTLQVNLTPAVSGWSDSASVTQGSQASFAVTTTGQPPFTYQWDFDSAPIAGATNATYAIPSAQASNSGSYQLFITNAYGHTSSPVLPLSVTLPPVVNGTSTGGPASIGGNATFTVFLQGAMPLTNQWYFETDSATNSIASATNSVLTLTNVQLSNAGSYQLFVTNAYGNTTSAPLPLVIVAGVAPAIGSQPRSETVPQGFLGSFQVLASGTAPLSYQWWFDGNPISNATNAAIYLDAVQASNAGSYQVVVTNVAGGQTSAVATLTVQVLSTQAPGVVVTPLLSFSAVTNGSASGSALTYGPDGFLYVTTAAGGTNDVSSGGDGTISKLDTNGNILWTISLAAPGGVNPGAGLVSGGGNLFYGTTANGGAGFGTVFRIDSAGDLTSLYSFTNGADGAHPQAALTLASDGYIYGTTSQGGTNGQSSGGDGTVFKMTTNGVLVWSFSFNGLNGRDPVAALLQDPNGTFYGTTFSGGSNNIANGGSGTVFAITTNGAFTSLYSFTGGTDGSYPVAGLAVGPDGGLYGTTTLGGNLALNAGYGFGAVFDVTTNGILIPLANFNGTNGVSAMGTLTLGSDDNFYGTTLRGGADFPNNGYGTVYRVSMNGDLITLVSFDGSMNGAYPSAAVTEVASGIYYGTTSEGGTNDLAAGGDGSVFRLGAPAGGPGLANIVPQTVQVGQTLSVTNQVYGGMGPITLLLTASDPAEAGLTSNGVFYWTPACENGSTTNQITIWAIDSSVPALSNAMTFTVVVGECVQISIGSGPVQIGQSICVPVTLLTTTPLTNISFTISTLTNRFTNWSVIPANPGAITAMVQAAVLSQPQFTFGALPGQMLSGSNLLGYVCVSVFDSGHSAYAPLTVGNIVATTTADISAAPDFARNGELVLIQGHPLLDAIGSPSGIQPQLILYGNPGTNYFIQYTTSLNPPINWLPLTNFILSGLLTNFNPASLTDPMEFYRAYFNPPPP